MKLRKNARNDGKLHPPANKYRDHSRVSLVWKFERSPELYPPPQLHGLNLPLRMAAGLGVARSRRNMAKNPQPQLPRSTSTGIRGIPGTSAEAVKIPPLSLLLSPFASPVENYLCTRAYKKKYT